ncbi:MULTISPECIES: ABC transporter ATP-binding protein [unclassified Salinibacterium]|uniref:ABC transporter ATP-binding protein n=1 Tax=unclassified Salinibacterium TaxID=2632331 RepID=UPI00142330AC|nr:MULTISPECIES: ABC transporter ATP-binding protein [unclassified Salinibacterium]
MTDTTNASSVVLRNVVKSYGNGTANAVDNVSLTIAGGEFMTFLGPSGSGKTTTLNAIAGFLDITSGEILIAGEDVSRVPAHKRDLGMVFQHYALFPHLNVLENVAFPLARRGVAKAEAHERARAVLKVVGLEGFEERLPKQLSGGQQQRVAVARAVVYNPRVVLMDEPLGALDKRLREQVQTEIKRLHRDLGLTFIYVTHDQEEALALSDRIAVFNDGSIAQVGTAEELYERPANRFVANFLGESTIWSGSVDGDAFVIDGGLRLPLPADRTVAEPVAVMVRPENLRVVAADAATSGPRVVGRVVETMYLGSSAKTAVELPGGVTAVVRTPAAIAVPVQVGDEVAVTWNDEHAVFLAAN